MDAAHNSTPTPCQGSRSALWFSDDKAEQRLAAALCEDCPMSRYWECRDEGMRHETGVWGGLTPAARRRLIPGAAVAAKHAAIMRSREIDAIILGARTAEMAALIRSRTRAAKAKRGCGA